ncbi:MAG: NTP transferase domain-containing protein [Clostridiales bacterium]|nr:NTP transferase domain-containing protein [Clostridiales bacterium]
MKAVIMAGGEGKRLRPLTCDRPKPMVYVANRPIMEHIVNLLKEHNIFDIALTLQYMPNNIKDYFGTGDKYGVNFRYYQEDEPLGTAGSVKNVQDFLNETFVVISGDVLTDIDITKALEFHKSKNSVATMILKSVPVPLEYGVVVIDDNNKIEKFLEKPNWGEVFSDTVNTGIYILEPEVFEFIPKGRFFDFGKDVFPRMLRENVSMYGYISKDYWCDIGDITSYRSAHKDILDKKVSVNILGNQIAPDIWIGENVQIDDLSEVKAPCIIGSNVKIRRGVKIGKYTVIGDNNLIDDHATIKQSIVWNNSIINNSVNLRGAVIANNVTIKKNVCVYEGSVIGGDCDVLEDSIINPDVKIWPHKKIDRASILKADLIWGTKYTKNIFGERGINAKIVPEYVTKLGQAYASFIGGNGRIGIASSNSNISKLMKMAFSTGILRTGLEVFDFKELLVPMLRFAIRFYKLDGGIYINDVSGDFVNIEILNKDGCNIESFVERKIENMYNQQEFLHCDVSEIKPMVTINDYSLFYAMDIINGIKFMDIGLNVVVNTNLDMVQSVLEKVFDYMKCKVKFVDLSNEQNVFPSFVTVGGFDLGIEVETNGENFILVDNKGRVIDQNKYKILVILMQLMKGKDKIIVAPTTASGIVEKIAQKYGGQIKRTKSTVSEIMKEMLNTNLSDQFGMYFDAVYGIVNILEFMKENNYSSSDIYDMIPQFYMNKTEVVCKGTDKGKIIKCLIKENYNNVETKEGVKIYTKDGWALILPSIDKASVKIISEGVNSEIAQEISSEFERKIKGIINTSISST